MLFHGPPNLYNYCSEHSTNVREYLTALERKTKSEVPSSIMLSGHIQGKFLEMICQLLRPKSILEIGSYTGYSAICMAVGLPNEGHIHSIDNNLSLRDIQNEFLIRSGMQDRITFHIGEAEEVIPTLNENFDLVFIDANKIRYTKYYELVLPLLRSGGVIVADNVLYGNEVLNLDTASANAKSLDTFNKMVQDDPKVENILLPLLDGISIIRKL